MSDNAAYGSANGFGADQETTAKFDRDELVRGWREYEARMPRVIPVLKYAAKTDMGQVRENNEDKFDFYEPEIPAILAARGSLFAVGDGIGGALAGQIASEMMLKQLVSGYYNHPAPDLETALRAAIAGANDRVHGLAQMIPERSGMGTTLTCAVFIEDRVVIAQVGDSRAYLIREGEIAQMTRDHSWVEEQVRAGMMSRSDAEMSPFRNVITRSIGAAPTVEADLYVEEARIGDVWVLCSDGLTGHVEDAEIGRIAGQFAPSEAARQLIELANARGGHDNVTVFVLSVRDLLAAPDYASSLSPADREISPTVNTASSPTQSRAFQEAGSAPSSVASAIPDSAASPPMPSTPSLSPAPLEEARPRVGWRKIFGRQS
jgi:protein phosphatase